MKAVVLIFCSLIVNQCSAECPPMGVCDNPVTSVVTEACGDVDWVCGPESECCKDACGGQFCVKAFEKRANETLLEITCPIQKRCFETQGDCDECQFCCQDACGKDYCHQQITKAEKTDFLALTGQAVTFMKSLAQNQPEFKEAAQMAEQQQKQVLEQQAEAQKMFDNQKKQSLDAFEQQKQQASGMIDQGVLQPQQFQTRTVPPIPHFGVLPKKPLNPVEETVTESSGIPADESSLMNVQSQAQENLTDYIQQQVHVAKASSDQLVLQQDVNGAREKLVQHDLLEASKDITQKNSKEFTEQVSKQQAHGADRAQEKIAQMAIMNEGDHQKQADHSIDRVHAAQQLGSHPLNELTNNQPGQSMTDSGDDSDHDDESQDAKQPVVQALAGIDTPLKQAKPEAMAEERRREGLSALFPSSNNQRHS